MYGSGPDKWRRQCQLCDWLMTLSSRRRQATVCGWELLILFLSSFFFKSFFFCSHCLSASFRIFFWTYDHTVADTASFSLQTKLLQLFPSLD